MLTYWIKIFSNNGKIELTKDKKKELSPNLQNYSGSTVIPGFDASTTLFIKCTRDTLPSFWAIKIFAALLKIGSTIGIYPTVHKLVE